MCVGLCIGSALCCAGAACCKCLCLPAKMAGVAAKNYAKIGYVVLSIGWIILTIILMYLFNWIFDWSEPFGFECPDSLGGSKACVGASTLIRVSWALALFHIIMLIIVSLRTQFAAAFHDGCWGTKFLLIAGILVASLWIPNDPVINGYMEAARVISVIFLMYQALLILLLAYSLNDVLVSNVEKEGGNAFSCSGIILIVIFVLVTGGNITWLVFQYIKFTGEGCGANLTFIIISTVLGVLMYGVVLIRTRNDASMLTSAIVWAYQLYLQWSAMSSNNDANCNPYLESPGNTTMEIILGLTFTFLCLLVVGGSTTKDQDGTLTSDMAGHMMEKEEDTQNYQKVDLEGTGSKEKVNPEDAHIFPISTATILFQALMVLASVYYSMLLTNWGNPSVMDTNAGFFGKNEMSYWV